MSALLHLVEAATALTQLPINLPPQQASSQPKQESLPPMTDATPYTASLASLRRDPTHTISDDDDITSGSGAVAFTKMNALRENHLQALRAAAANAGLSSAQPVSTAVLHHKTAPPTVSHHEPLATPAMVGPAVSVTPYPQQVATATSTKVSSRGGSGNGDSTKEVFPMRLHALLSDPTVRDVISWLPHGKSFVVLRSDVFATRVLPRYFAPEGSNSLNAKTATVVGKDGSLQIKNKSPGVHKYPSFTRKLNRWGFRQISRGPDAGAFCHEMFQRDNPDLCRGMVCQKSRKSKRAIASAAGMPDDMISVSSASTMGTRLSACSGEKRPYSSTVTVSTAGATSNKSLPFKKRKSVERSSFMMNGIPSMISHRTHPKVPASNASVTESDLTSDTSSVCSKNSAKAPVAPSKAAAPMPPVQSQTITAEASAMEALARHFQEQHRAFALASLMENSRLAMEAAGIANRSSMTSTTPAMSSSMQIPNMANRQRNVLGAMTTHSHPAVFAPTVEKKVPTRAAPVSSAEAAKNALYEAYVQALSNNGSSSR
mmetsp:Transcript_17330/g.29881  ORF Transcript_17330/g.29881 Transcript_17330/m.29881 type:complete len:544 (+) Transcript_17330:214-1845(+)|eukprot:CAMPEP_0183704690 /NCGR_PEP_ID=MMETSP0737-20130205/1973_1 /TAXON_ID=385413 /ORGANISM="Thalassiosira miniscula, Strain CCMP1093" /LENGTH=543 /DNA_ID=CAMNT_0025931651 /DNA_START=195 /DNA_END=1826 /DNA_ORIENTATION=+